MINANGYATSDLRDSAPPSDLHAEMHVIGQAVLDPATLNGLHEGHLVDPRAVAAFHQIRTLQREATPVDAASVAKGLRDHPAFEHETAAAFIATCWEQSQAATSRLPEYQKRLRDLQIRRQLLHSTDAIVRSIFDPRQTTDDILQSYAAQLEVLTSDTAPILSYATMTLGELDASDVELEYLCHDVLVKDQPLILGGPPKCLKTLTSSDLTISLATGTKFLGIHEVPRPVRVCVMSGESGIGASRICYRSVAASKGFDLADIDNVFWSDDVPLIGTPAHMVAFREHLKRYQPEVIILDPAYRALAAGSPENMFEQGKLLGELNGLCRSHGATLILIHHTKRKPGAEFGVTTLDDLAWAGFREFFRQWILISRRAVYEPGSGLHELRFDTGGSARHSWAGAVTIDEGPFSDPRWYVTVQGLAESQRATSDAKDRQKAETAAEKREGQRRKLIEAAAKFPEGETISMLRTMASLASGPAREALGDALTLGELVTTKITKNGRTEDAYKLSI